MTAVATAPASAATITVYTMEHCQPCRMTKNALAKRGIGFQEISLMEDPEIAATLRSQGFAAAPVVMTANGDAWAGYQPSKIAGLAA